MLRVDIDQEDASSIHVNVGQEDASFMPVDTDQKDASSIHVFSSAFWVVSSSM